MKCLVNCLYHEKLYFFAIEQWYSLIVHEYNSPLKGSKPQTRVAIRLIFPDYDRVGYWQQTDLKKSNNLSRYEMMTKAIPI